MKLSDFEYDLPAKQIAKYPTAQRDGARMMLLERATGRWEDSQFMQLPDLLRGDEVIVVNNVRVMPARLLGRRLGVRAEPAGKRSSSTHLGSVIEVLLTRQVKGDVWEGLVRPGRKVQVGEQIVFGEGELEAEVIARGELGLRQLRLKAKGALEATIKRIGHIPLPPYIDRPDEACDRERYQTVFAHTGMAVAAPTAGLHFTQATLARLKEHGIEVCELTLQVGLGTFQPVHEEEIDRHKMGVEEYEIPEQTAERIVRAKREGRPVLAVGTTVVRALEHAARRGAKAKADEVRIPAGSGEADIFIRPGETFRVVDQLLTNFHLPRSTLLILVAAFAGREAVLEAYRHAVRSGYRFYSYGDCMLIR